jgi:RNA polymerase sigma-70 factor (ECF subfamily)
MVLHDDQALIHLARNGDLNAFNDLIERYQDMAYSVAYRLMGDAASAADMTQEALILAYRKLSLYHGGSFKAWLMRIVSNRCYDELRRYQRERTDYLEDMAPYSDDGAPLAADTPSPEQVAQQNELQQAIQDCISALGPDQRVVLVMCDVQGMAYQEIADATGSNIGTVKSRLSRARLAMRDCLRASQELLPAEFRLFE